MGKLHYCSAICLYSDERAINNSFTFLLKQLFSRYGRLDDIGICITLYWVDSYKRQVEFLLWLSLLQLVDVSQHLVGIRFCQTAKRLCQSLTTFQSSKRLVWVEKLMPILKRQRGSAAKGRA